MFLKMERGFQEYVSTKQVIILLSCQLALAMSLAVWKCGERNAIPMHANPSYVRTCSTKVFPSLLQRELFSKKPNQECSKTFHAKLKKLL